MSSYTEKLFSLRGKVAIVSGASRGIEASIIRGLPNAVAPVMGLARAHEPEQELPEVDYRQCDILAVKPFGKLCKKHIVNLAKSIFWLT
jgi:NADP-dependent 3-hydroxy acid dehydrogenase YdfG